MKLMRLGPAGQEKPVVRVDDSNYVDLSDVTPDFDEAFFGAAGIDASGGGGGMLGLEQVVAERVAAGAVHPFGDLRVGAPIARPHQILCIGLNYSDHAAESGMAVPEEPILFTKSPNTLVGPNDDVRMPRGATKLDWEVELGIVIGKTAKYVSEDKALDHVAGYCVINDVSERAFQTERQGQWTKGKSCDTFGPTGPWLVTRDEVADPQDLKMWLTVNGKKMQNGSTKTMVYGVAHLVSYLSQFMSLLPGDIISTGTPPGVGMGMKPPKFLKNGDVVALGIEGLGEQKQKVIAWK